MHAHVCRYTCPPCTYMLMNMLEGGKVRKKEDVSVKGGGGDDGKGGDKW